jgi:heterodisulfide reductase subunit B
MWGRPLDPGLNIIHFSEILSIALGMGIKKSWLKRHLVDPLPLLKAKGFLERTAAG